MRLLCSTLLAAATILALAAPPALAGNGSKETVYTWVDAHGVRHYSDQPGAPDARLLTFSASGGPRLGSKTRPSAPAAKPPRPSSPTATVPAAATTPSPAERAARCSKLRAEVTRLEPARRLKVNENGKSRYLSGDNLVAFKKALLKKMRAACVPTPGSS